MDQKPFKREWDGYDHHRFLRWALNRFEFEVRHSPYGGWPWSAERSIAQKRLHASKVYRVGKNLRCLDGGFESFFQKLSSGAYCSYRGQYKLLFYSSNGVGFRQKLNKGIPARAVNVPDREQSEAETGTFGQILPLGKDSIRDSAYRADHTQARIDWREHKGFKDRLCGYRRGCPPFYKKESHRERRNTWKRQLAKADWDNQVTERRRDFIDPWRWD